MHSFLTLVESDLVHLLLDELAKDAHHDRDSNPQPVHPCKTLIRDRYREFIFNLH